MYKFCKAIFFILFILVIVTPGWAEDNDFKAKFSWLPITSDNVSGYRILYGLENGGPYSYTAEVGNPDPVDGRIHYEITGLNKGLTYYFVCVYINDQGEQSDYSSSVKVIGPPKGITLTAN